METVSAVEFHENRKLQLRTPDTRTQRIRDYFESVAPGYAQTVHSYASYRRAEAITKHAHGRILEVGCGSGAVTAHLVHGGKVVAGDLIAEMARQTAERLGVSAVVFDGGAIPFGPETFDSVVCAEAIYYMDSRPEFLAEARRVLKPEGVLLLSCMAFQWRWLEGLGRRLAGPAFHFGTDIALWSDRASERRLIREMGEAGYRIMLCHPVVVLPFESLDRFNVWLERTPLARLGLFWVIGGQKEGRYTARGHSLSFWRATLRRGPLSGPWPNRT